MTYRTDNKIRRYVKGYGFMSFAKKLGSKYGKKIMNKEIFAASKFNQSKYGKRLKNQGSEFGKISGKKIIHKSAEATGDLIGSKIADKITLFEAKENPQEIGEEPQEIIIPPDKRQQMLDDLKFF